MRERTTHPLEIIWALEQWPDPASPLLLHRYHSCFCRLGKCILYDRVVVNGFSAQVRCNFSTNSSNDAEIVRFYAPLVVLYHKIDGLIVLWLFEEINLLTRNNLPRGCKLKLYLLPLNKYSSKCGSHEFWKVTASFEKNEKAHTQLLQRVESRMRRHNLYKQGRSFPITFMMNAMMILMLKKVKSAMRTQ